MVCVSVYGVLYVLSFGLLVLKFVLFKSFGCYFRSLKLSLLCKFYGLQDFCCGLIFYSGLFQPACSWWLENFNLCFFFVRVLYSLIFMWQSASHYSFRSLYLNA